jgi:hypothetical protein
VETKGHDQYEVKMDGSGKISLRNRKFLRPHSPYTRAQNPGARGTVPANTSVPSPSSDAQDNGLQPQLDTAQPTRSQPSPAQPATSAEPRRSTRRSTAPARYQSTNMMEAGIQLIRGEGIVGPDQGQPQTRGHRGHRADKGHWPRT